MERPSGLKTSLDGNGTKLAKLLGIQGVSRDISERKQSEKILLQHQKIISMNNRIAGIFLTSASETLFADVLDILLEELESSYGYFGYIDEAGDLVCPSMTRNVWDQCELPEKDIVFPQSAWGGLWGRSLQEKTTAPANQGLQLPEGHVPLQNALAVPIVHHDTLIGQFVLANKTGGFKESDQELLESAAKQTAPILNARMEQSRRQKEHELLNQQLQQAQKMEAIGTLAGGIAHDFNNILYPLMGFTEMLKEDVPSDSPLHSHIDEILQASFRAKDLVKQILAFSRQGEQELRPIKLQPIIKEALKLLRSSIPATIEMKQEIDPACGVVVADPTQIHQIIMNLATNAYHAMEEKGGSLTVSLEQVRLESEQILLPELAPGDYAMLRVTDTGPGIEKDQLDKIFDPYFTTKGTGKGTGLGLSVVQGIVKRSHGDIQVLSEPGQGTEVQVYLPVQQQISTEKHTDPDQPVRGGTEKILLVDDEASIVKMEQQMLERLGYTVTARTGSFDALEAFKADPQAFDVVVTDMTMPNMTGVQLAAELKKIRPNIPVVLCTGFSYQVNEENSKALGIDGFVMKPVIMKEIAATIRKVLDK